MDLLTKLENNSESINNQISNILAGNEKILDSMRYSAIAKGKKLRSFIFLEILEALGEEAKNYLEIASAIELLHAYSLIHDDLPAMDDAKLRRGKRALHLEFDEATAILAGDALLTLTFEVIARQPHIDGETKAILIREIAIASGYKGMIEGQLLDINSQGKKIGLQTLKKIHHLKTGQLFKFCAIAPCFITNNLGAIHCLENFAYHLGILYQITDDILDFEGSIKNTGKDTNKDIFLNKLNYISLCGLEKAREYSIYHAKKANYFLGIIGPTKTLLLQTLVELIQSRKN